MSRRIKWWAISFGVYAIFFVYIFFTEPTNSLGNNLFLLSMLFFLTLPVFFHEFWGMASFVSFILVMSGIVVFDIISNYSLSGGWMAAIWPFFVMWTAIGLIPSWLILIIMRFKSNYKITKKVESVKIHKSGGRIFTVINLVYLILPIIFVMLFIYFLNE